MIEREKYLVVGKPLKGYSSSKGLTEVLLIQEQLESIIHLRAGAINNQLQLNSTLTDSARKPSKDSCLRFSHNGSTFT